jgi:serine/threonine protein kinase/tetratricopeptide (TPR) repeat protein
LTAQKEGTEQDKRACVLCGNEFPGNIDVCPNDGTLLTPISAEPKPGDIFADRYEILSVIGDGGMGKVYKARHSLMKRIVAIKMLLPHFVSNPAALKRFQQEAQAASALNHPHILYVHDFGISKQGLPFLVMDYLEGVSLSALLQEEGQLDEKRAVPIFIQACSALAHAHQKGVIHRDIKPANIMLINYEGQSDYLKIVDFGIAKLMQPDGAEQLTHTGEVFGSPLYMSPEQCRGKELDARSDIYSLGCVLYRTVTGRALFGGRDAMECMYRQVNDQPVPFSELCPELGLSKKLEDAVLKAVAKEPGERYSSMSEFKDALEDVSGMRPHAHKLFSVPPQSGQEVAYDAATDQLKRPVMNATQLVSESKSADSSPGQAAVQPAAAQANAAPAEAAPPVEAKVEQKPPATNPVAPPPVVHANLASAAATEQSISIAHSSASIPPAASESVKTSGTAGKSADVAVESAAADGQISGRDARDPGAPLSSAGASKGGPATAGPSATGTSTAGPSIAGPSAAGPSAAGPATGGPLVSGATTTGPSAIESSPDRAENSQSSSRSESTVSDRKTRGTDKKIVFAGVAVLVLLMVAGIGAIVMNSQEKPATSISTNPSGPKSNKQAETLVDESETQIKSNDFKKAEETLEKANGTAQSDAELMKVLPKQAFVYQQSGKFAQAEESWKNYLQLQEKNGATKEDLARTRARMALPVFDQGRVDEASQLLDDAKKVLADAPDDAEKKGLSHVLWGISKIAVSKGDLPKAEQYLQQAIDRRVKVYGADDADLIQFYQDQGAVFLLEDKLDLSEKSLSKALQLANRKLGPNSPEAADAYKDLATIAFKKGQLGKSEKLFTQSLSIKKRDFGEDSLPAAELMATMAMLYTREGKFKQAEPLFKQALEIRIRELGADSPEAKRTKDNYAVLQARMKKGR